MKSVYFDRWMSGVVKELFPGLRLSMPRSAFIRGSCRDDSDVNAELKQKAVSVAHLQQKLTA